VAVSLKKESKWRSWWNRTGLLISSLYLAFTLVNKATVNRVFEHEYRTQGKSITRFSTYPTPLNNFLWYSVGESRDHFHIGLYSVFDKEPNIRFMPFPKNHDLLNMPPDDRFFNRLKWMSNGYYTLTQEQDTFIWHDLRFGVTAFDYDSTAKPVFGFKLIEKNGKYCDIRQEEPNIPELGPATDQLMERIRGN
jgi:inner membrane protein